MNKKPFFSIVIPALNEEASIGKLLGDLSAQIYDNFEVILVDGNSEDKTIPVATKAIKKSKLTILKCEKRNVSIQRNRGGKVARGKWIIFMDADNRLDEYFLLGLRYKISRAQNNGKDFDVFSTLIKLNEYDSCRAKHKISTKTINSVLLSSSKTKTPRLFGAMLGVKKEWFAKLKFDEDAKFAEDIYYVRDLIADGAKYHLIRSPRYMYSMRRWGDKDLITTSVESLILQLKISFGDDHADVEYEMSGGTNY